MLLALVEPAGAVEQSAMQLVRETVLGAICIVATTIAVWAVLTLKKVQDQRVTDQVSMADRAEKSNEKDRERTDKQTVAIVELAQAIKENTRSQETMKGAIENQSRLFEKQSEWMRTLWAKSSGQYSAVRPKKDED